MRCVFRFKSFSAAARYIIICLQKVAQLEGSTNYSQYNLRDELVAVFCGFSKEALKLISGPLYGMFNSVREILEGTHGNCLFRGVLRG